MTGTCRIPLGRNGQYEAVVDAEDYAWLTQWTWSFKRSQWAYGSKIYARRCVREPVEGGRGKQRTIYMHVLLITERMGQPCPGEGHEVDHADVDSLNNTRANLRWLTKSANNANQRPRIPKATRITHDARAAGNEDIPF